MKTIFALVFFFKGSDWKVYSVEKDDSHIYSVIVKKKLGGGILYRTYYTDKVMPPEDF
jgi:hypothetical protein